MILIVRRIALCIAIGGTMLLPHPALAQAGAKSAVTAVDSALVFGPARGSLVVQLVDSAHHAPLPGGFLELARTTARFEPAHFPARFAPTAFSLFGGIPAGPYVLKVRRIAYLPRSIPVVVRAGGSDTLTVALDFYHGCDICGEVVPSKPRPTASGSGSKTKKP